MFSGILFFGVQFPALPRGRTGRSIAGYKLVGHDEQVSQHIPIDAREANQHGVIWDVVIRNVVNIGIRTQVIS